MANEKIVEQIFLNYAREDLDIATRIYKDLSTTGLNIWFDSESLLPGKKWKSEIKKAIRDSKYFIALLSSHSVSKRGYVQTELREALEILDEFPESGVFIIPVRLEDCKADHPKIQELHWLDLFPSYDAGIKNLMRVFKYIYREPIKFLKNPKVTSNFAETPSIDIEVGSHFRKERIKIRAVIDIGADISYVEENLVRKFEAVLPYSYVNVEDLTGKISQLKMYIMDVILGDSQIKNAEFLAVSGGSSGIGWDILKQLIVLIDGPKKTVSIWEQPKNSE